jgi:hypothetical protein
MDSANAYVIRYATVDDVPALRRLVQLDGARLFCGPAIIGEIGGVPAAAVSLANGRVIADPSRPTTALRRLLRMRHEASRADTPASARTPPSDAGRHDQHPGRPRAERARAISSPQAARGG